MVASTLFKRTLASPALEYRKRIALVSLILIIATALCYICIPQIYAEDDDMGDSIEELMQEMVDTLDDNTMIDECASIMLGENSNFRDAMIADNGKRTGLATSVMNTMKIIAMGMLVVYVVMDVIKMAERSAGGQRMLDVVLIPLLKMAVAGFCILYSNQLANALQDLGKAIFQIVKKTSIEGMASAIAGTVSGVEEAMTVRESIEAAGGEKLSVGFWEGLPQMLSMTIIQNPICHLLKYSIKMTSYSLFFELAIRKAFIPIALCGMVEGGGGMASPGLRYLKSFLGVHIKMAVMILAIIIAYSIPGVSYAAVVARGSNIIKQIDSDGDDAAPAAFFINATPWGTYVYDSIACRLACLAICREGNKIVNQIIVN